MQKIDILYIRANMRKEDCEEVIKAVGKYTYQYVWQIAKGRKEYPEVLMLLKAIIEMRLRDKKDREEAAKEIWEKLNREGI